MSQEGREKRELSDMRYQVKIAGKIFQGSDTKALVRLAVAARREAMKQATGVVGAGQPPS